MAVPEILAVRQDEQDEAKRGGEGSRVPSDILSVYLEGGPRYHLGDRLHRFEPPIAMLAPKGTFDRDMQEGKIRGIFVLFGGNGILRWKNRAKDQVEVKVGPRSLVVPAFKRLTPSDGERLASVVKEIGSVVGAGLVGNMRRIALLYQALSDYCEAGQETGRKIQHREAARLRELVENWAYEQVPMSRIYRELELSGAHADPLQEGVRRHPRRVPEQAPPSARSGNPDVVEDERERNRLRRRFQRPALLLPGLLPGVRCEAV
jgi:hypothetical protein